MHRWFVVFLSILSSFIILAQPCTPDVSAVVIADSGIKLRSGPGTNFPVAAYIPKDSIVVMCTTGEVAASFEGIEGFWRTTHYRDIKGYAFDGFVQTSQLNDSQQVPLSGLFAPTDTSSIANIDQDKAKPISTSRFLNRTDYSLITEVYNFCGDISKIDPGMVWYGIYREEDQFFFKRREIQVLKSKYNLSKTMEFDIKTENSEKASHFLLGFPIVQDFDTVAPIVFHSNQFYGKLPIKIFPGMQMELYGKEPGFNEGNVILSAVGNVKDVGICPDLENYQLRITGEKAGSPILQNLNKLFIDMGQCGIPELFWFGDLNADGYPELIFVIARPEFYTFSLFTSDTIISDAIYRRAATWTIDNCE